MIRFIDLGKQIAEDHSDPDWPREFAFYDTLQASFLSFSVQQIFDSYEDVIDQMDDSDADHIKSIMGLIPAWVQRGKRTLTR